MADVYDLGQVIPTELYSTDEVKTHKVWIDNKPIYRKVFTNISCGKGNMVAIGENIENVVYIVGTPLAVPYIDTSNFDGSVGYYTALGKCRITTGVDREFSNNTVILEYTKITD